GNLLFQVRITCVLIGLEEFPDPLMIGFQRRNGIVRLVQGINAFCHGVCSFHASMRSGSPPIAWLPEGAHCRFLHKLSRATFVPCCKHSVLHRPTGCPSSDSTRVLSYQELPTLIHFGEAMAR